MEESESINEALRKALSMRLYNEYDNTGIRGNNFFFNNFTVLTLLNRKPIISSFFLLISPHRKCLCLILFQVRELSKYKVQGLSKIKFRVLSKFKVQGLF